MDGEMPTNIDDIAMAGVGLLGGLMLLNFAVKSTEQLQKNVQKPRRHHTERYGPKHKFDYGGKLFDPKAWMP